MSNDFYTHNDSTGVPLAGARGVSSLMRAEFEAIEDGFDIVQNYAVDTGTANAMVIAPPTAIAALTDGLKFRIKAAHATTAATTVNLGATLGTVSLKRSDGTAITSDIKADEIFEAAYSSTYSCLVLVGTTKNYADQLSFSSALPAQPGTSRKYFLRTQSGAASWELLGIFDRRAITSTDTVGLADVGNLVDCTSGTFTLAFAATATVGDEASGYIQNSGTGDITLDPNGAETIDGLASYVMYPGEVRKWYVEGSAIKTIVVRPFSKTFTSSGTFTKPPGYTRFGTRTWSAGSSGQRTNNTGAASVGGGGGGCFDTTIEASTVGTTETVTIGAGGAAVTGVAIGNTGGDTSLGTLLVVKGGGATHNEGGAIQNAAGTALQISTTAIPQNGFAAGVSSAAGSNALYGGGTASSNASANSGSSVFGGGAGGSVDGSGNLRTAGSSKYGGAGGAASIAGNGTDGTAPGGGGGATQTGTQSGAGARGELRIWGVA